MSEVKINPDYENTYEYKMSNAPVFSLNDILSCSSAAVGDDNIVARIINRYEFETMAKERYDAEQKRKKDAVDMIPDGGFSGDY